MFCPVGQRECATYTDEMARAGDEVTMREAIRGVCEDGFENAASSEEVVACGYDWVGAHEEEEKIMNRVSEEEYAAFPPYVPVELRGSSEGGSDA